MSSIGVKQRSRRVLILDHGERLGGVEKFIAHLCKSGNDYEFERVCVDANNWRLGYDFYVFIISRRVKFLPDVVVTCHIDTARLGCRLSKKFKCPHIFREPSGLKHQFMTSENASMLKKSTCVALTERGLNRWRDCGFTGPGFVVPPYLPRIEHKVVVWPKDKYNLKVLFVANLYPEKRHLEVIDAMRKLNASSRFEVSLHIYGVSNQDAHSHTVKQAVEQCDFASLSEGGVLSPSQMKAYDFAVLASSHEGFGNVLIEYIQAGLPFIASNSDGISQMISSDSILLLPEHTMAWSEAFVAFIQNPDDVQREMERLQHFLKNQTSFVQQFKHVIDSQFVA